jgi:hypothetical protein
MMDDPGSVLRTRRGDLTAYPLRGTRRAQPRAEDAAARTRAVAQRHLDAREERLRAYAAVLEAAAAGAATAERRASCARRLARVRHDLRTAGRPHLPEPPPAPRGRRRRGDAPAAGAAPC